MKYGKRKSVLIQVLMASSQSMKPLSNSISPKGNSYA